MINLFNLEIIKEMDLIDVTMKEKVADLVENYFLQEFE